MTESELNDEEVAEIATTDPVVAFAKKAVDTSFSAGWNACIDTLKLARERLPSYNVEQLIQFVQNVERSVKK